MKRQNIGSSSCSSRISSERLLTSLDVTAVSSIRQICAWIHPEGGQDSKDRDYTSGIFSMTIALRLYSPIDLRMHGLMMMRKSSSE